jgi:hypothetical protein
MQRSTLQRLIPWLLKHEKFLSHLVVVFFRFWWTLRFILIYLSILAKSEVFGRATRLSVYSEGILCVANFGISFSFIANFTFPFLSPEQQKKAV